MDPGATASRHLTPGVQAALVGLATLVVYLALPERVYFFDGVLFAGALEYAFVRPEVDLSTILFAYPKHYLYQPTVYALARPLSWVVPSVDVYRLMQITAGCAAGLLNGILFLYLRRRFTSVWACLSLVSVWAFSNVHWERALEGQTYFAGQFWAILTLLVFASCQGRPSTRQLWSMALFTALGGLYHVTNVIVIVPVIVTWAWTGRSRALRPAAIYLGAAAVLTGTVPVLHYRLWDADELRYWMQTSVNSTSYHDAGYVGLPTLQSFMEQTVTLFAGFLVPLDGGLAARIIGLAVTVAFVALVAATLWSRRQERTTSAPGPHDIRVLLGLTTLATWGVFFSVAAPGYLFHWEVAAFGLWLTLVAGMEHIQNAGSARLQPAMATLLVLAAAVPIFNLTGKYWAISRHDYNQDAQAAARIGPLLPPQDPILLMGGGARDNNLKAYMLHFGMRGWNAMDVMMAGLPTETRCDVFRSYMNTRLGQRGHAYLSTDFLDHGQTETLARTYGCDSDDFRLPAGATCAVLDDAMHVGVVLAVSPGRADLESLGRYYHGIGLDIVAAALRNPRLFGSCVPPDPARTAVDRERP